MMRIGIDVGGTNTDAVLMQGEEVVASRKASTTADIVGGLTEALSAVLGSRPRNVAIDAVIIGTTQLTNALVERRHLQHVGIIRIGLPATSALPPLCGWPSDLIEAVGGDVVMVRGGHETDGRPITDLDETAILDAARRFRRAGISSVAITSVFSPVAPAHEMRAAQLVSGVLPEASIALSSDFGTIGLLERENATVVNGALVGAAAQIVDSFDRAVAELALDVPVFLTQNDGTLLDGDRARRFPILTFASGPTNSMRGATRLSGIGNAIVVDIGGTTSDIGTLVDFYPRPSSGAVDVGGVRTNFRMPDLLSIGIGGGSLVNVEPSVSVGPKSVGYELAHKARCFGGDTLTATDIAVAGGHASLGRAALVADVDRKIVQAADEAIHRSIENGIDRVKTGRGDVPVILVGGGAILVNRPLAGASHTVRPPHAAVANAVGAAAAQIGAELDHVVTIAPGEREATMHALREAASAAAISAGAKNGTVKILSMDETTVAYSSLDTRRVRIKAVGELDAQRFGRLVTRQLGALS